MSKQVEKGPPTDESKEGLKVKKKVGRPKKLNKVTETVKLDLSKKKEDAVQEPETKKVVLQSDETKEEQKLELQEVGKTHEEQEPAKESVSPVSEITEEEVKEETKVVEQELKEAIRDEKVVGKPLPENIEKLVSFMEETGGNINDYVRLNADYTNINEDVLLREYYKQTKPHLDREEVDFILEDNYSWDEDVDEERAIKKKKLAYKEEIAKARNFLEQTKSKYYDEIKLRPGVTQEQQKAMDFFNRYNKEQDIATQQHADFEQQTNKMFSDEFKGFEFNVGEKRFRYGVSNPQEVAKSQSNLSHFVKKFLNEDGSVKDHVGYHKAIYAAENADTIAKHFYEQGKADAVKDVVAKSKNINVESRTPASEGDVYVGGFKVKAISGVDSSKLKIQRKIKK
tara:strand:+ start:784 stop:1977 length:1194 start_codon:yes stop_codon:yes gene_type:complete